MTPTKFFIGRTVAFLVVLVLLGGFFAYRKSETAPQVAIEQVKGCYYSMLDRDVYTLNIQSQKDEKVTGTLAFNHAEKDSSKGTFEGMFKDGLISGVYTFTSEGISSTSSVAFKKQGNSFIQGFEQEGGGMLHDPDVTGSVFVKGECK